ncbi:phosphotransferase [Candidatus Mycoplasma pogonae]
MKNIVQKNFPDYITSKLKHLTMFYEGLHNYTFTAFYKNQKVQIRISKEHNFPKQFEIDFLKKLDNYLYISKKGNFIKKWIDGNSLENQSINFKIKQQITEKVLKLHQEKNLTNEAIFSWESVTIYDSKFWELAHKYQKDQMVICHNDLRLKNIIIDLENQIHLIDFEWIRWNNPYFDYACLYLFCQFTKEELISLFNLELDKLNDFIYLVSKFNEQWEKEKY